MIWNTRSILAKEEGTKGTNLTGIIPDAKQEEDIWTLVPKFEMAEDQFQFTLGKANNMS